MSIKTFFSNLFKKNENALTIHDLKIIADATQMLYPIQGYNPKNDTIITDCINYMKIAVGGATIVSLIKRLKENKVKDSKSLAEMVRKNELKANEMRNLRRMCGSFSRRKEEILRVIDKMESSKIGKIRNAVPNCRNGHKILSDLIPKLQAIVGSD